MEKTSVNTILYASIKAILVEARSTVYQTVNTAMVTAYWNIGRLIVEEEQTGKVFQNRIFGICASFTGSF